MFQVFKEARFVLYVLGAWLRFNVPPAVSFRNYAFCPQIVVYGYHVILSISTDRNLHVHFHETSLKVIIMRILRDVRTYFL